MKISNTSTIPIETVRALVRFAAARLEVTDYVEEVKVTETRWTFRGRCFGGRRVLLRIGPGRLFPLARSAYRQGAPEYGVADRLEALVAIAGHEFQHSRQFRAHAKRHSEVDCEWAALRVLEEFRADRAAIMAGVETASATAAARAQAAIERQAAGRSPEARIGELEARVAAWQTKVKRATTFLKKWERRLRRAKKAAGNAA
jgi:hypothetical protein